MENLLYGSSDIPLCDEGIKMLNRLKQSGIYPKADQTTTLYTTGFIRTEQTFEIIYGSKEHQQIAQLREFDFGDFELRDIKELEMDQDFIEWSKNKVRLITCPNGESLLEFRNRVEAGLFKVLYELQLSDFNNSKCIIICHGGVISMIMGKLFPKYENNMFQYAPLPGRGYSIYFDNEEALSYRDI
jgi:broad specificity phosphatase PhoE